MRDDEFQNASQYSRDRYRGRRSQPLPGRSGSHNSQPVDRRRASQPVDQRRASQPVGGRSVSHAARGGRSSQPLPGNGSSRPLRERESSGAASRRRPSRPVSPRTSSNASGSAGVLAGFSLQQLAIGAIALIVLLILVVSLVRCASAPAGDTQDADSAGSIASGAIEEQAASIPAKLEGAQEETDANGIVHGTMPDGTKYLLFGRGEAGLAGDKVSLAAVGDVFATDMNFPILDGYAGSLNDGQYDFEPYYQGTRDEISQHDIRFLNQETPCAGNQDGYEYSGYPIFNTPDSSISAFANVGFNVVNFNSNHTWDQGEFGITRTQQLIAEHPQIMLIGSYASAEDRDTVRLLERNGSTIAFLSYSYGDNMYGDDPAAFPNQYYTCNFDQAVMKAEIARAKTIADAVVVYMHWGEEYTVEPSEQQLDYASFLADQGVDLVIGSHAHSMQPIRYVTGEGGAKTLVVFGLSDFITGWTITDTIISGMFSCDFEWQDGKLCVANPVYTPAIEWSAGSDVYVRFLKDMTDEEIAKNTRTEDVDNDLAYLRQFVDDLGMEIPVNW